MFKTVKFLFCNQLEAQNYKKLLNYVVTWLKEGKVIFFKSKNKKNKYVKD